jgi:hypothetical protein
LPDDFLALDLFDVDRLAVDFFAVDLFDVDFFAVERFAVDRFDVDLFAPFFAEDFLAPPFLAEDFRAPPFLAPDFFDADFLEGTFAPSFLASDNPMAMAWDLDFTFLPLRPLFNLPRFFSCMALSTFSPARFEYFAIKLIWD